jgi:hypothetical protein
MTESDIENLRKLSKSMLDWQFPHPLNTKEGAEVLHDVSALLIKVSNHINKKIELYEQSNIGEGDKGPTATNG